PLLARRCCSRRRPVAPLPLASLTRGGGCGGFPCRDRPRGKENTMYRPLHALDRMRSLPLVTLADLNVVTAAHVGLPALRWLNCVPVSTLATLRTAAVTMPTTGLAAMQAALRLTPLPIVPPLPTLHSLLPLTTITTHTTGDEDDHGNDPADD